MILSKNKFALYRSLKFKKIREREGKFLIEGLKFCQEAFSANVHLNAFLYYPHIVPEYTITQFISLCQQKNISYFEISHDMLKSLSDTVHSQGVLCVVDVLESRVNFHDTNFILAIDAAQEPGNVGTIIRTADWFGVDAVLLGDETVDLYNPKVLRATMGSVFHLPIIANINLNRTLLQLKEIGFTIYAADIHGHYPIDAIQFSKRKLLIVGNEHQGIHPDILEHADYSIKIPPQGQAESLNLAVATGIILNQMVITYASQ